MSYPSYPWQESQWQSFSLQLEQQRVPHAFLLLGVEGLGQLQFANEMAATILCTETEQKIACGRCHSCQLFSAGSHPDHTNIEPEEPGKQIKIDQIRRLKDKQELTPTVAKWKTVIISPANNMNVSASNSLLKLLEEPQNNTLLILISEKPERLPITVISRCQKIILSPPSTELAIQWLQQKNSIEPHIAEQLLPLAKSAPIKVLELIESGLVSTLKQLDDDFESLLQGQANPVQMAKSWLQYDLSVVFNYLQNNLKQRLIRIGGSLNTVEVKRYWVIYDCIIVAIKLTSASNNINKSLLVEQFMGSVIDVKPNNNSTLNILK